MKYFFIPLIAAVFIALRVWMFRKRRSRRIHETTAQDDVRARERRPEPKPRRRLNGRIARSTEGAFGEVGMVAMREIKERVRGRLFRVGTLFVLLIVAAAIVIPSLHKKSGPTTQTIGVFGSFSPSTRQLVRSAGSRNQDRVRIVQEPSLVATKGDLRTGKIDLAVVDSSQVLLNQPASSSSSPADPTLVQDIAQYLGVLKAYESAGLTPAQASEVDQARAVPVETLQPSSKGTIKATSVIGLVLLFVMLNQYDTWILIGVMQEKSSRVVEVLLATLRPIQLLGGKVLGIGLVALGQATVIVGFALILAKGVGSDVLHGSAPLVLVSELLWLILGYAFYCWVYAAAGSTAERQDQVQTLALPLSIPILVGYIYAITVASSGNSSLFFKVLAYLPPTAPFCMPVLVGLHQATWWQFIASVLISIAATVGMAVFAARVYRRAVVRTGGRVHLRELFAQRAH